MINRSVPITSWLALAAAPLAVFAVFYGAPVLRLLAMSLYRYDPAAGAIPDVQFGFFRDFLTDSYTLGILWRTLRISLLTTIACAIIGYPVAFYLTRATGWRLTGLLIILLLPLVTSVIVVSYGWLILLGPNGLVNTLLVNSGLSHAPVKLMFTEAGMVIGLSHTLLVFMVMSLAASVRAINANVLKAARSLGAGPWRSFGAIIFPLTLPGLRTGSLLVFSLSMSAYATPALIGGARLKVLSVLIYQQSTSLLNWPSAAAMAVVLLAGTSGMLALVSLGERWRARIRAQRSVVGHGLHR